MRQDATTSRAQLQHLPHLDGVRALAACYVVLYHIVKPLDLSGGNALDKLAYLVFSHGHAAVNVFITLSGFCLMLPVIAHQGEIRGGALHFYAKRCRRILPPYYVALALSILLSVLSSFADSSVPLTTKVALADNILVHFLLVHDFTSFVYAFNGAFWSIAVEFRIYLLFPVLLFLWRRLKPVHAAFLMLAGSLVVQETLPSTIRGETFHYVGLFALGMLAAEIAYSARSKARMLQKRPLEQWICANFALFAISLGINFVPIWRGQMLDPAFEDTLMGIWAASVFVTLSLGEKNRIRQWLSWPPLCFIGTFAYSIYLIHMPLLGVFNRYVCVPLRLTQTSSYLVSTSVAFPAVLVIAYGFFLIAEKPFLSAKQRAAATTEQAAAAQAVA